MPPVTPSKIFATGEFCRLNVTQAARLRRAAHRPSPKPTTSQTHQSTRAQRACGLPPPKCSHFGAEALALLVGVLELALCDFLEGHRQVVLGARFDEGRREVVER